MNLFMLHFKWLLEGGIKDTFQGLFSQSDENRDAIS